MNHPGAWKSIFSVEKTLQLVQFRAKIRALLEGGSHIGVVAKVGSPHFSFCQHTENECPAVPPRRRFMENVKHED